MSISVSGKQIDVGESLKRYSQEHLEKIIQKYTDKEVKSEVVFSRPSHKHEAHFRADIMIKEISSGGLFVKSNHTSDNAYNAFDLALEKIDHRLNKYKSKIKDHRKEKLSENYDYNSQMRAVKYVMTPFQSDSTNEDHSILSEKQTDIEILSVNEAIMKMDLQDLPALLFRNKENDRINVVYHRADGNISWIDPKELNK